MTAICAYKSHASLTTTADLDTDINSLVSSLDKKVKELVTHRNKVSSVLDTLCKNYAPAKNENLAQHSAASVHSTVRGPS